MVVLWLLWASHKSQLGQRRIRDFSGTKLLFGQSCPGWSWDVGFLPLCVSWAGWLPRKVSKAGSRNDPMIFGSGGHRKLHPPLWDS